MSPEEAATVLADAAMHAFARKKEKMEQGAMPYIKDFVEQQGATGLVGVPVTDGRRVFNLRFDINEAYSDGCKTLSKIWEKTVLLTSIDKAWQEQLREMDQLRSSVQNASYEQKDPLVIYKIEAYELWKKMLWEMNSKAVATLLRGKLAVPDYEEAKARAQEEAERQRAEHQQKIQREYSSAPARNPYANYSTTRDTFPDEAAHRAAMRSSHQQKPVKQPIKAEMKVGRNDPCPCGSGKKYKNCHGKGE